jgi:phage tail-like protein
MATGERTDPYRGFNFRVEIDNTSIAAFSEVSGLTAEGDPVEYRAGTDAANTVRKLVGLRKYANITLKRGYLQDNALWQWYQNIADGVNDRRSGTIVLMDEAGHDVMRWNFENAWINKIEGPALKASGNEVAIESAELCHEGLRLDLS